MINEDRSIYPLLLILLVLLLVLFMVGYKAFSIDEAYRFEWGTGLGTIG